MVRIWHILYFFILFLLILLGSMIGRLPGRVVYQGDCGYFAGIPRLAYSLCGDGHTEQQRGSAKGLVKGHGGQL